MTRGTVNNNSDVNKERWKLYDEKVSENDKNRDLIWMEKTNFIIFFSKNISTIQNR